MARRALIDPRIARMVRRDRQVAGAAVLALWCVTAFVYFQIAALIVSANPAFAAVSAVVGLATLILISVSISAYISRADSEIVRVYGPEIQDEEIEEV